MKSAIVFGLIGAGFVLLVLSGVWTGLFPGTSSWTPEKAERWSDVKDRLHNLSFIVDGPGIRMHSGPDAGQAKAEYEQLKIEGEQLKADFESAYDQPRTVSTILKWTGVLLAIVGVIGWYGVKNTS